MIQSPLNYTGGKFKLLPQILPLFPKDIDVFVDLFCGGCNVGINVDCNRVIYNDLNENLLYLYNTFKNLDKEAVFEWIYQIIDKYGLSVVSKYGYEHYNCDSSKGLGEYNKDKFIKLRADFNEKHANGNYDYYYYVMYSDFFLWLFNGQAEDPYFIISQTVPVVVLLLFLFGLLIKRKVYERRNRLKFKMVILQKIVAPEEKESNLFTLFAESISRLLFKEAPDYAELYKKQISNIGYTRALWRLGSFAKEQLWGSSKVLAKISFKEHRLNKIKWKRYKKLFKNMTKPQ